MISPVVLVVCHRTAVLREAVALCDALEADGRFHPALLCSNAELARRAAQASPSVRLSIDFDGMRIEAALNRERSVPVPLRPIQSLRQALLQRRALLGPLWTMIDWLRLRRVEARLGRMLDHVCPSGIFGFDDRTIVPEVLLQRQARARGIPTVLVPFAVSSIEADMQMRLDRPDHHVDSGSWKGIKRWIAQRFPEQIATHPEVGRLLFFPVWESLALVLSGFSKMRPWVPGGNLATHRGVLGDPERVEAVRLGVPAAKVSVTGQPSLDRMAQLHADRGRLRQSLAAEYGLNVAQRWIICAVPQTAEEGLREWEPHLADIARLFELFSALRADVLLSLHPKSDRRRYASIAAAHGLAVARNPLSDILPAADIFQATFSSTVRWALMLGIPSVVFDPLGRRYDIYKSVPGVAHPADWDELASTLAALTDNSDILGEARAAAARGGEAIGRLDGRAGERLIGTMARLCGCGARPVRQIKFVARPTREVDRV